MSSVFGTMTLGELIAALEKRERDQLVYFDFGNFVPRGVDSYRGYYDHLAIGFSDDGTPTVAGVLKMLKSARGKSFEGYKGGAYTMCDDSPVWAANHGKATGAGIVGIHECEYMTVIETRFQP